MKPTPRPNPPHDTKIEPHTLSYRVVCRTCGYVGRPFTLKRDACDDEDAHHEQVMRADA